MSVYENIESVRQKISAASQRAGRSENEITLIGVSKTKPVDLINEAIECGICDLGENRVQEVLEKFDKIENARWHLIGHLQKNKVKYIVDKAVLIHSVESFELAKEIDKQAKKIGKIQDILIQVNVSGEESKFGVTPRETLSLCEAVSELENVRVKGLMTMAPMGSSESELRFVFGGLRKLCDEIKNADIKNIEMKHLSMGMSGDYEIAIEEGATMVRVGTGIFGTR